MLVYEFCDAVLFLTRKSEVLCCIVRTKLGHASNFECVVFHQMVYYY